MSSYLHPCHQHLLRQNALQRIATFVNYSTCSLCVVCLFLCHCVVCVLCDMPRLSSEVSLLIPCHMIHSFQFFRSEIIYFVPGPLTHSLTHSLTRQPEPHEHVQNMSALPRNKQQRRNSNSELATSYIAHKTNLPSLSRFLSRACRPPVRRRAPYRPLPLRIWGNREHNPINAPLHVHVHAVPAVTPLTPKKTLR